MVSQGLDNAFARRVINAPLLTGMLRVVVAPALVYAPPRRRRGLNLRMPRLEENAECLLVPGGMEGISVIESSNGQDPSGELVLRFVASIKVNREAYNFATKHMLAIRNIGKSGCVKMECIESHVYASDV